eukprot:superscaffoldBa00001768_g11937
MRSRITRSGRIVPDKEYRHKLIQRAHQRHVRECLAQAIFHKVLEMERLHQIEIKRKLEEFARRERVHKIKVERSKRYEEEIIRILSPRPPTGARGVRKQHSGPEGEHSESSESPNSSRPNTAPGKMQRPVRLKPIQSNGNTASLRRSSPYRLHESSNENDQPFNCTMDKESRRRFNMTDASRGISPYCLPVINNFVTPVPPATKRKERGMKVTPSGTVRGRRLRPTTASSGADVHEEPPMLRSSVLQSRVCVNMVYFGKTVHLSHDLSDMRDEVKVFQQHCGGENLCVYKGKLREGEMFQFISRRHRGFPFSLTFFLNGLQVERLSSCCEFKHRKGSRLGGRHGHFGFSGIEGASPCYKCIIAMGLDKKPTPPPKRVKDDGGREETVSSPKTTAEMEMERTGEDAGSHSELETSQPQDLATQVKEETAPEEDKLRDDYEEDFEADDEGPVEDAEEKEKKSPSPSIETEKQVRERDASETEDDEKDEDAKSHSGSSCSGSDREESDTEAPKDSTENEKVEQPTEVDQEETTAPSDEKDEPNPEEAAATAAEPAAAKDSDIQDSAGDSTEIDISDASVPSGNENKQSDDTSGDKEDEKTVDESKQEEEQERAKSVQEKLAEAILKESQCSSEPELSDTSTEEEEEATDKGHKQDNEDAVLEKSAVEAEVVEGHEEMSEPKEQKDETEQEPHESSENYQDEMVKKDEDVEKAASEVDKDEAAAEKDESEVTGDADAAPHPVSEEKMAEDDKASESQDNTTAKSAETEAADKDEENEQKTADEAETLPDETRKVAKSSGEDESSVSELYKKTDETEVPDNAEAEATTASETMEMKAEPSEEREALSCEEAPVTNTERQQEDGMDRTAGSETEVTADNSSSSSEGSRDTTVHAEQTADTSGDNAKDESSKDDVKEEEAEEASGEEAYKKDSETEEIKEDSDDKDSDSKNDNTQNQVSEVIVASSGDGAPSSTAVAIDLDSTDNKENEESDSNTDKHPHIDENAAAADLSAADGENGRADTEEASKASEEGASVLLKPQVQSTELPHNNADNTEEKTAVGKETPEALAKEDNSDLVTNWVTMHQTSKYFETFVEPLEELRDSDAQTSNSNTEATQSTELLRSVSPLKTVKMSDGEAADGVENAEEGNTQKDVNEAEGKTEVEVVQSDLESNESEDDEPGKDTLQVDETEVKNLTPNTETEHNVQGSGTELSREDLRSDECKGSRGSLEEDRIQDGPVQRNTEETDISKTEVESIAGTNHSGASGKPESVTENQTEEKMTENEKQTAPEERKDLLSLPKTEEHQQCSESPELVSADMKADEQNSAKETQQKTDEESQEVTEITDFTTAKSDDGSQEEIEPKPSDSSINGDRRDTQLIQDIKHTLSKDRLSMFSVDETLFGRGSYPLLTTTRTESGH